MLLVTGGAGFIGSNIVASLNEAGRSDIVVNDTLGTDGRWHNLAKRQIADFVQPHELTGWLEGRRLDAVIHMGAISDTTVTDGDLVMQSNFRLSLTLLDWCTKTQTPFIYASSAATYGNGEQGFSDEDSPLHLQTLRPMNLYGWSKHLFDQTLIARKVRGETLPPQWAGLKFFNVFGPNEYHKGKMASVLSKIFDEARAGQAVRLFKSHKAGVADGDQRRDFIYIDDVVAVVRWFMDSPRISGLFNVGTGHARSFREMIEAMFAALNRPPKIEYIDTPESIRGQYQYFTQSEVGRLRAAGYNAGFAPLEEAVHRYVTLYLDREDRYR